MTNLKRGKKKGGKFNVNEGNEIKRQYPLNYQEHPPFLVKPEFSLHCLLGFHTDLYPRSEKYNTRHLKTFLEHIF